MVQAEFKFDEVHRAVSTSVLEFRLRKYQYYVNLYIAGELLFHRPHVVTYCCEAVHGVAVITSAFLAYHQCCCTGSSLAWGLNLPALVRGIF